jgi:surface carbohydrate biosynthesis protein
MTAAFDNLNFYSARKSISKSSTARFAVFQRGPLPIETLNKATESGGLLPRDAVFCYTDTFAKEWNTGGAEMISSGTLLSKVHINQSDQEKLTSRVGFISSYQHYGDAINGPPSVAESVFYKPEIAMLRPLLDSMNKLGYELDIIGRCVGDITKEEHAFYETHLGQKGWRLLPRQIKIGSYKVLAQYPMIFSAASTLGLEALSSHLRVMFLDMTSAANYRDHFWSTSESSLRHSRLLLREKEITTWENQVLELLKVDDLAFELLAQAVVGKGPMTTSFDDIQAKIKLMLGQ